MNRDEILNMPAGYEINKLVAINVMGWALVNNHGAAGGKFWIGHGGSFGDISEMYLPDFSGDMNVAWSAIEKLKVSGFEAWLMNEQVYKDFPGQVYACKLYGKGIVCFCLGETMPLAICRAALLAVVPANSGGV